MAKQELDLENLLNAKVVFGLKKQGHIETIETMLAEGKNWDEIANKIGWCPMTAREHYEKYHLKSSDAEVQLAKAVELLRKYSSYPEMKFDKNTISQIIFHSEKHLKSTPRNNSR